MGLSVLAGHVSVSRNGVLKMELKEIHVSMFCMVATYDDGTEEKFPYGYMNEINRVVELARHLKSEGVLCPDSIVKDGIKQEKKVFGREELLGLSDKPDEAGYFHMVTYNSNWGGYRNGALKADSVRDVIRKLRHGGVVCPSRVYKHLL